MEYNKPPLDSKLLIFRAKEYIKYRLRSKDEHGIHSPFLFSLYNELMQIENDNKDFYFAENFREELLNADESIKRGDVSIPISDEVENSALPEGPAQLIYKLIRHFRPTTILELGTNAGLSSLYMALAMKGIEGGNIYSIEGNNDLYDKAMVSHAMLRHGFIGLPQVNFILGNFKEKLPETLSKISSLDFVFIDGDHRGEALLDYFNQCLAKANDNSIFVLDDIYWSPDMLEAWKKIIEHPRVRLSLDLYSIGVLFFDTKTSKEHFTLKWTKQKADDNANS